jgi:hypothetical protein
MLALIVRTGCSRRCQVGVRGPLLAFCLASQTYIRHEHATRSGRLELLKIILWLDYDTSFNYKPPTVMAAIVNRTSVGGHHN